MWWFVQPVVKKFDSMLKLATMAKFHFGQLIWWKWWFHWIPLFKRTKIDLKIIKFGQAKMCFWIYAHTCKLSRSATPSCRLMKSKRHVTSPPTTCINISGLQPHLAPHSLTYYSLSFSHWFIHLLGISFYSHMWQGGWISNKSTRLKISEVDRSLTNNDQGLFDQVWLRFWRVWIYLTTLH